MLAPLTISASLYKAHVPWLTEAYVELDLSGLGADYPPASLHATIPGHRAGEIGQLLCGLACRASATQKEEIRPHRADVPALVAMAARAAQGYPAGRGIPDARHG